MNIDFDRMIADDTGPDDGLDALRMLARQRLLDAIEAATEAATGPVPLAEKLCWAAKEAAARAVVAGSASEADHAMIGAEAAVTGEDADALAARILRNADAWRATVAALTGLRRAGDQAIAEARDADGVQAACAAALAHLDTLRRAVA